MQRCVQYLGQCMYDTNRLKWAASINHAREASSLLLARYPRAVFFVCVWECRECKEGAQFTEVLIAGSCWWSSLLPSCRRRHSAPLPLAPLLNPLQSKWRTYEMLAFARVAAVTAPADVNIALPWNPATRSPSVLSSGWHASQYFFFCSWLGSAASGWSLPSSPK